MNSNKTKRFAWLAAIACVGCCGAIPILTILGVTGVVGLSWYFEIAAVGFFLVSASFFGYTVYKKSRPKQNQDCACQPNSK